MFYVIGEYGDGENHVLGSYDALKDAQYSVWWQGQPRGELNWHDAEKTRAETWYSGGRWPATKTQWVICKASHMWGVFAPLDGAESVKVTRGCYTAKAFKEICDMAYEQYHAGVV